MAISKHSRKGVRRIHRRYQPSNATYGMVHVRIIKKKVK